MTIFELTAILYSDEKPKYPEFEVSNRHVGYFTSLDNAGQAMRKNIEEWHDTPRFGYLIDEYPLDKQNKYHDAESRRSYLPDGELLHETLVSEISDEETGDLKPFPGRPADKARFKIGELVEVLYGERVSLEIVGNLPNTPKEVRRCEDYIDDAYYTLNKDGEHSHPASVSLFPARLKISKSLRKKLFSDEYYSYRAYYDNRKENQQEDNLN